MTTSHPVPSRKILHDELDRARQTGDAAAESALLLQLGNLARDEQEYDLAPMLYAQARDAYERAGDAKGCADALCALVELYALLWWEGFDTQERRDQTLGWLLCADVIAQYEQLGDEQGLARAWVARADLDVMSMFSDGTALIRLYDQAIAVYERAGDLGRQAHALSRIAYIHKGQNQMAQAEEFFERAIALYEQTDNFENAVALILKLADFKHVNSDYALQTVYYTRAIAHYETLKQPLKIAGLLERLGRSALQERDYVMAVQYFARAVALHEQYGERLQIYAQAFYNFGQASIGLKDGETAKASFLRALSLMDDRQWVIYTDCLLHIGMAYAQLGDLEAGRVYAQRAFVIGESINDTDDLRHRIQLRQMWATIEMQHNHPDQARQTLNAALAFAAKYLHGQRYTAPVLAQLAQLDSSKGSA